MTPEQAQTQARAHLGELSAMADQTERAERQILERAQAMLKDCEAEIAKLRGPAQAGDEDAARQYQDKVQDRGRLEMVISQARSNLD